MTLIITAEYLFIMSHLVEIGGNINPKILVNVRVDGHIRHSMK